MATGQQCSQGFHIVRLAPVQHNSCVNMVDSYSLLPFRNLRQLANELVHVLHAVGTKDRFNAAMMDETGVYGVNERYSSLCAGVSHSRRVFSSMTNSASDGGHE